MKMKAKTRNILLLIPLILSVVLIGSNCAINKGLVFCKNCWPSIDFNSPDFGMNWSTAIDVADYVFVQLPTSVVHTYSHSVELGRILKYFGVEKNSFCGIFDLTLLVSFVLCLIKLLFILFGKNKAEVPRLLEHKGKVSFCIGLIVLYDAAGHDPILFIGLIVLTVFLVVCWRKSRGAGSSGVLEDLKNIKIKIGGS